MTIPQIQHISPFAEDIKNNKDIMETLQNMTDVVVSCCVYWLDDEPQGIVDDFTVGQMYRGMNILLDKIVSGEMKNPYIIPEVKKFWMNENFDYDAMLVDYAVQCAPWGEIRYSSMRLMISHEKIFFLWDIVV